MNNIILEQKIRKHLQEVLNEFKVFPQSGYCLILVGGPASGKTFLRNNIVPINGKLFDLDMFYKQYKQINKKISRKDSGEKLKKVENMFLSNQNNVKNNIIFDICGRPERNKSSLIEEIISMVKPLGYKIGICWVVCNRSVAIKRNMERDRVLPDDSLHRRHNQILKFLPQFITSNKCQDVDDVWISFSSSNNLVDTNIPKTIKLKKGENGFIISEDLLSKIYDISGPLEKLDKHNPTVYYSSKEIKQGNNNNVSYLRNQVNENIITESFTDIIYHFTTINNLEHILRNESFILSKADNRVNDKKLNRNYKYYMSFTREHSVKRGYPATKNKLLPYGNDYTQIGEYVINFAIGYYVRITFDGTKLNTLYKGIPVNYHYLPTRNVNNPHNNKTLNPIYLQSEDRLLSNNSTESRIFKCITNIDIYCPNVKNDGTLKQADRKIMSIFKNVLILCNEKNINVRIYNDLKNFDYDLYGTKYITSEKILSKLDNPNLYSVIGISNSVFNYITQHLAHMLYNESKSDICEHIEYILGDFAGYEDYEQLYNNLCNSVIKYINDLKNSKIKPMTIDSRVSETLNNLSPGCYNRFLEIFEKLKQKYDIPNAKSISRFFKLLINKLNNKNTK